MRGVAFRAFPRVSAAQRASPCPLTPEAARQLADLGAFALLILTWSLLAIGYFRKWFVPGWLYDALFEEWRVLRDQGDRNSKALELSATSQERLAKRYEQLRRGQ